MVMYGGGSDGDDDGNGKSEAKEWSQRDWIYTVCP